MIITRAFVNPELMIAQGVMAFGIFVDIIRFAKIARLLKRIKHANPIKATLF